MRSFITAGSKIAISYLLAGAAYLLYFKWPNYGGNPHVPFSGFPEFLLWSPVAPYLLFEELLEGSGASLVGFLVFVVSLTAALVLFFRLRIPARPS